MAFTGNENHSISLQDAAKLAKNFRTAFPNTTKAHFFGRDAIEQILAQPGCVGIRANYGLNDQNEPQLVLVGTDANEHDMHQGVLLDASKPCPPYCGQDNTLNS
ncbi:MAG: hypothetical protein ACE5I1_24330 [bacterium]